MSQNRPSAKHPLTRTEIVWTAVIWLIGIVLVSLGTMWALKYSMTAEETIRHYERFRGGK